MSKYLFLGALSLGATLIFAVPAFADHHEDSDQTEQTQTEDAAAAEANPNDRICRRVRTTGSNIPQRICMSRAEWSDLREESQEALRENRQDVGVNTDTVGSN